MTWDTQVVKMVVLIIAVKHISVQILSYKFCAQMTKKPKASFKKMDKY